MSRFAISVACRAPLTALLLGLILSQFIPSVTAQPSPVPGDQPPAQSSPARDEVSPAAARVDIEPVARDDQIRERLERILTATGWFYDPTVRVEEGVVFLRGRAQSEELKVWAGNLARNTQDVAAVANQMSVRESAIWDFSNAQSGLTSLWRDIVHALPLLLMGLIILACFAFAAWLTMHAVRIVLMRRISSRLLRGLFARVAGVLVLVTGLYIVLRISGLTQLALTIIGGTGLVGLALGIAFRDITENYLASIFLSIQRPFRTGDLVEIADVTGYVQQLNVRTTILMALDGTLTQLPNAMVYKNPIRNFSDNPNIRVDFTVGIGYEDRIDEAQEVARRILEGHPAVLNDPEPWVLAEELGRSTVTLRVFFWLNGREHSFLKVRSSVIRLVKRSFQDHGISMPDEAREVIFPRGVPVTMLSEPQTAAQPHAPPPAPTPPARHDHAPEALVTPAEGGLSSEANTLDEQARHAHQLDDTENLLRAGTNAKPAS
ncbi:MAG: BON domain-containing protein [Phycisphaeraceae bacterium]|nr:MAG: BON domain-containing protein [Phycisphaeraceae bacterium]